MRLGLVLCVVGISAVAARADVRVFFTSSADPAGLTDLTHVFDDTDGGQTDGSSYKLTDAAPTVGVPTVDASKGEFLYLWLAFEDAAAGRIVQGINMVFNDQTQSGGHGEEDRGVYLGLDDNGDGGDLRWNHKSTTYDRDESDGRKGVSLIAVTEPGIQNSSTDGFLYRGGEHVALLGAIKPHSSTYEIRLGIAYNGVSYRSNDDDERSPMVKLGGNDEKFDGHTREHGSPVLWSTDADAYVVPEPATVALLLAAGLILRRR